VSNEWESRVGSIAVDGTGYHLTMKRDGRVPLSASSAVTCVSPLTKRRADAQRNREHLISVAIQLLSRDSGVTMDEIAAAAGVGRTTLFRHFPSREVLLDAVGGQIMERMHGYLGTVDFAALNPVQGLAAILQLAASIPNEFPFVGIMIATPPMAEGPSHDKLTEAMGLVQTLIEAGQTAGTLRTDAPAAWLAGCFVRLAESMVEGLSTGGALTHLTEDEAASLVLRQFIDGAGRNVGGL
jgi:TetR/AcrR family transcriptional regulator, mexCD-oprJ operon repressor